MDYEVVRDTVKQVEKLENELILLNDLIFGIECDCEVVVGDITLQTQTKVGLDIIDALKEHSLWLSNRITCLKKYIFEA